MGQRDIRRLLIIGAMGVVRSALRKGASEGSWLQRMLARKPKMLVAIARANKMARSVWAMLAKGFPSSYSCGDLSEHRPTQLRKRRACEEVNER